MRVDLFDFDLPEERIALRPASRATPRGCWWCGRAAALRRTGWCATCPTCSARRRAGPQRHHGHPGAADRRRARAARRRRASKPRCISASAPDRWRAFARPAKRLAVGDRIRFGDGGETACLLGSLDATVIEKGEGGEVTAALRPSPAPALDEALAARRAHAAAALYRRASAPTTSATGPTTRPSTPREEGAVAAPTAGLHFTAGAVRQRSTRAGVDRHFVTLHVGAGTFLPVKADDTGRPQDARRMGRGRRRRRPRRSTPPARAGGRIVAVGTTSLRLLESAARRGRHARSRSRARPTSSSRPATASAPSTC